VDSTIQFLDALAAGKPDESYILVWLVSGDRKHSAWFQETGLAAAYVREHSHQHDVYVGVALSPADHGPHVRLKIEGGERPPSGIFGLWADVDIAGPGHTKKNLPPTAEQAMGVLFPEFRPSIVVHSGGGLQMWWLFREPWMFDDAAEMLRAGTLATRWIRALRARAGARGWDIDPVGDLTRVLRIPGTSNCKVSGNPRPVRLLESNDLRYNQSELEEYLDIIGAERVSTEAVVAIAGQSLIYSSGANPPSAKFEALMAEELRFAQSWHHKRADLQDQSASAYDISLADYAVQAMWTDQEICDLIIGHRRRHSQELKLRDSYIARTIAKARAKFSSGTLIQEIQQMTTPEPPKPPAADGEEPPRQASEDPKAEHASAATEAAPAAPAPDPLQHKAALTARISEAFKLEGVHRIVRVTRYMSEPRVYALEIASGECVRLGDVSFLIDPGKLQLKIAELAGRIIPNFKRNAAWMPLQQALLDACVDVPVGDEGTDAGMALSWLRAYLESQPVLESIDKSDRTRSPFARGGRVHIYMDDLRRWVHLNRGDRVTDKEMGILLRRAAAEPVKVAIGKSSRQVWVLPDAITAQPQGRHAPAPDWVTAGENRAEVQ
jgi:hypothetical protein